MRCDRGLNLTINLVNIKEGELLCINHSGYWQHRLLTVTLAPYNPGEEHQLLSLRPAYSSYFLQAATLNVPMMVQNATGTSWATF